MKPPQTATSGSLHPICSLCDWRSLLLYALGDHSSVKVRIAELRLYERQMGTQTFQRRLAMLERDLEARRRLVGIVFHARPKRWWANTKLAD